MTTYLLRHAPTAHGLAYRVDGEPGVHVPLTPEGEAACMQARSTLPVEKIATGMASPFPRCQRTAELLLDGAVTIATDLRLGELDYGDFEGGAFLAYARWLAQHGPDARPSGARESQAKGIARMLTGLRAVLERPAPRLVVAHGLLVSVVRWAGQHPDQPLIDVFLPEVPYVAPLVLADAEVRALTSRLLCDLARGYGSNRDWRVDLGAFPVGLRALLLPSCALR